MINKKIFSGFGKGPTAAAFSAGAAIALGGVTSLFADEFKANRPLCGWLGIKCGPPESLASILIGLAWVAFIICCIAYGLIKSIDSKQFDVATDELKNLLERVQVLPGEEFLDEFSDYMKYGLEVYAIAINHLAHLGRKTTPELKSIVNRDITLSIQAMLWMIASLTKRYDGHISSDTVGRGVYYSSNLMRKMALDDVDDTILGKMFRRETIKRFDNFLSLDLKLSASTRNDKPVKNQIGSIAIDAHLKNLSLPLPNNSDDHYVDGVKMFLPGAPQSFVNAEVVVCENVEKMLDEIEKSGLGKDLKREARDYLSSRKSMMSFASIPIFLPSSFSDKKDDSDSPEIIAILNINSSKQGVLRSGRTQESNRFVKIIDPMLTIVGFLLAVLALTE